MQTQNDLDRLAVNGIRILGFACAVTWLIPHHPLPLSAFYHEWVFALLACIGALLLFAGAHSGRVEIGGILPFACAAIAAAALCQAVFRPETAHRSVFVIGYAGFAYTLLLAGRAIHRVDLGRGVEIVSECVLAGALGSAFIAALQLSWLAPDGFVAPRMNPSVYGNLAQANHFSDLMWFGMLSVGALYVRNRVRGLLMFATVLILAFFSVCSASRAAWLDAFILGAFGVVLAVTSRRESDVRRFGTCLVALPVVFLTVYMFAQGAGLLEFFDVTASTQRMLGDEKGNSLRLWLWQAGLSAAKSNPWFGIGPGQFGGYSLSYAMTAPPNVSLGVDINSHNLFTQLAAEFGFPLAVCVVGALAVWGLTLWRNRSHLIVAFTFCVALLLGLRSMLEFPLWYAQFLGLLALLAGMAHAPRQARSSLEARMLAPLVIVIIGALVVAYSHQRMLERPMLQMAAQVAFGNAPQLDPEMRRDLDAVPSWSPFRPYADAVTVMAEVPVAEAEARSVLATCERSVRLVPSVYVLSRCSAIAALAGDLQFAARVGEAMCRVYPRKLSELAASLKLVSSASHQTLKPVISCVHFNED